MSLFGFDDQFALLDVTPVDNQFLLELMPSARGDYVRVYLYGLVRCYHAIGDPTLEDMAHELGLTSEDVMSAYRYWERRGLVRRVSDDPPQWKYINRLMRTETAVDETYVSFVEALQAKFTDRRLTSSEIATAYDWVEGLGLPSDVVLMLITYQMNTRGKHFTFKATEKVAVHMQEEGIFSIADAEDFFSRDQAIYEGCKKVLRILGKRREPSQPEMELYSSWIRDLGYDQDAIIAACQETSKGDPNFAYLDGILRGLKKRGTAATAEGIRTAREDDRSKARALQALLHTMNLRLTVNDVTLGLYADMLRLYPDDVILMAGRECARKNGAALEDVQLMLESWQSKGLQTSEDVQAYIERFKSRSRIILELHRQWGIERRPDARDRALLEKWLDTLHMSQDAIRLCADLATGKKDPLSYTDTLLTGFAQKGISDPAAMAEEHARHKEQMAAQPSREASRAAAPARKRDQSYDGQRVYDTDVDVSDMMNDLFKELDQNEQQQNSH